MDLLDTITKLWAIVLAKMDVRIGVLEEKIKALFDLWNKK